MSLLKITADSLSRDLQKEVPDIYVIVAKHAVMGMEAESIRQLLGCTVEELQDVENDPLYREVRIHVGAVYAQANMIQTASWDEIENAAVTKLAERIPFERDNEFLLRVAAVANRAQRRQGQQQNNVIDPTRQNGRTAIVLTQRLIQRISKTGQEELVQERQLSIRDGSMSNPSFEEIDDVLSVSKTPALPRRVEIQTHTVEPNFDELDQAMAKKGF